MTALPGSDAPEVTWNCDDVSKTCRRPVRRPPSPREDAPEALVGKVAVPKVRYKTGLPRENGTEVPVGRVAVPKTGQKNASPRGDATEMPVGGVSLLGECHKPEPEDRLGHRKETGLRSVG